MIIQFCGLSGAGKTTVANLAKERLERNNKSVEVIDGDEYRETLCKGLGYSKEDRQENLRRMAFVAAQLSKHGVICLIASINPFNETRKEISDKYPNVKLVHVDCSLSVLAKRDTKNLYRKALLPDGHPEKIHNLTGVNDPFDIPVHPDLYINTTDNSPEDCARQLISFIDTNFSKPNYQSHGFVFKVNAKAV